MGRVYKVIDQEAHAKVALKLIRPEIAGDQATIDRVGALLPHCTRPARSDL
jgi:hypothetical protein